MTDATPTRDTPTAPPPAAPDERPGIVTGAGITLIVLGVLTALLGLLLLLGAGLFAGAADNITPPAEMPELGGVMGMFAGAILVFALIVLGFGVLQFVSGLKVLGGRSWARVTGIVVATIAGLFALAGLGDADQGGVVLSLAFVAANAFVVFALATTGRWFAARPG